MNTRIVWKDWGRAAVLAAVYVGTAKLGLLVAIPPGNATAVWVPSGVALVATLLLGYRIWPVIWLSAMLVNLTTSVSLAAAAIMALGNASEAVLGVYLLHRLDVANRRFSRTRDVFRFLAVAGIASTVASVVGASSLGLGGYIAWSDAGANWLTWWLGDMVGIILVTPFVLAWRDRQLLPQDRRQLAEVLCFFVLLLVVGQLILGGWLPVQVIREMVYVFLVFLIWAAFRFGQWGATTAIAVMSGIAIWATVHGTGPFSEAALNSSLLSLQAFMAIMATTGLTLTAVVTERKAAASALQQAVENLEQRVQERTAKLEQSYGALLQEIAERKRAEETLRQNESFLDSLYRLMPVGVCLTDEQGRYVQVNDTYCAIYGYSRDELIGQPVTRIMPDGKPDTTTEIYAQLLSGNAPAPAVRTRVRKDGSTVYAQAAVALWSKENGERLIITGVIDVTERKKAEEAFQVRADEFYKALDTSPDSINISRLEDGLFIEVNEGFTRLTGYTRSDVIGKTSLDVGIWVHPEDRTRFVQILEERGEVQDFEAELRRKEGIIRIGAMSARTIEFNGERCMLNITRDITERELAQEALRLSEEKFNKAFYTSPDAVTINRLEDGLFLDVNDGFTQLGGYTRSETIGKTTLDLGIWVDPALRVRLMQSLHERGEAQNIEAQFRRRDGEIRIGLMSAKTIEINGERCFLAIVHDITDRKRAEEALRELSQLHQEIISSASEGISVYDHELRYVVWNRYLEEFTGIPAAQILGKDALEDFPEGSELGFRAFLERALAGEIVTAPDATYRSPGTGRSVWASCTFGPHRNVEGDIIGVIGLVRDVTERKLAEEALRQSEAAEREQRILAEALRDTAAALTGTLDPNEVMALILENVGRVAPHDAANIMLIEGDTARVVYQHGYTGDRPPRLAPFSLFTSPRLREMVSTGAPTFSADPLSQEPGWPYWPELAWVRSYAAAPLQVHGVIIGFLGLHSATPGFFNAAHAERLRAFAAQAAIAIENAQLVDELRHRAAELEQRVAERTAELDQERAQLQTILDSMAEGVAYVALESGITRYVNQAFSGLTGYAPEESVGRSMGLYQTVVKPSGILSGESHATMLRTIGQGRAWSTEVKMQRRDGSEFDASLTVTNVPGSESRPTGAVVLVRDIGQEKALQEQKDRFIASASHELRTPVTNLKMRLYLARRQPAQMAEHLVALERATDQLMRLIESMLDISRFERGVISLNRQEVVLQELVHAVIADQRPRAEAKQLRLDRRVAAAPIHVDIDPDRIKQAIDNLVVNAINYTPEGGRVLVQLRIEQHDSIKYATVRVRDTGIGIAPEALPRIFEPFYRAVEMASEGTGLGLTISREIIELHGGNIDVESQVGKGSTFSIRLPLEPATG